MGWSKWRVSILFWEYYGPNWESEKTNKSPESSAFQWRVTIIFFVRWGSKARFLQLFEGKKLGLEREDIHRKKCFTYLYLFGQVSPFSERQNSIIVYVGLYTLTNCIYGCCDTSGGVQWHMPYCTIFWINWMHTMDTFLTPHILLLDFPCLSVCHVFTPSNVRWMVKTKCRLLDL